MKITKGQLRQIIREEHRRIGRIREQDNRRGDRWEEPIGTFQGVHPLIDGLSAGNGVVPRLFSREREVMHIIRDNQDNPVYALALDIIQTGKPVPYLPFRFDDKLLDSLEQDGLDYSTVMNLKYNLGAEEFEFNSEDW